MYVVCVVYGLCVVCEVCSVCGVCVVYGLCGVCGVCVAYDLCGVCQGVCVCVTACWGLEQMGPSGPVET